VRLKPDPALLGDFFAAGAHLFPLTAHNDASLEPRHRGKRPWRKGWNGPNAKPLTPADARRHMNTGRNIGNRLEATDLVIDIDPRSFGDGVDYSDPDIALRAAIAALDDWCDQLGFDRSRWPVYITGSGGLHVRLKKPADVAIMTRIEGRPGFEVKTKGTYVVASGSVHPKTGRLYEPDELNLASLKDAPEAPAALLDLLRKPTYSGPVGGGEILPEELAVMLEALNPADFRDHDKWFPFMGACHDATGGDGEEAFVAWSASDPVYADDSELIRARWQSLQAGKAGNATVATLYKYISDAGRADLIPARDAISAAEDFDEPIDPDHLTDQGQSNGRPLIKYAEHRLPETLDAAEAALLSADAPLYQMQGQLARPIRLDAAAVAEEAGS
ncbi:MAG: bifunctional DNA primase/polymerase, partial [Bauldia sp.]